MISARKRAANRANAMKSSGPRSSAGKARAAQNARRHGLSITVLADPEIAKEVEALARIIAGQGASAELYAQARQIAESQLDVVRVRRAKQEIIAQHLKVAERKWAELRRKQGWHIERLLRHAGFLPLPRYITCDVIGWERGRTPEDDHWESVSLVAPGLVRKLAPLDRYERRALSRRKFAIRAFDLARQDDCDKAPR